MVINSYSFYLGAGNLISTYSRLAQDGSFTFKGEGNNLIVTSPLDFELNTKFAKDLAWNLQNNFEIEVSASTNDDGFTLTCPTINFVV